MTLHVDPAADTAFFHIVQELRALRIGAGLSQPALAALGLPVRGRAVCEWELGVVEPKLDHLLLWADTLGRQLVVAGNDGRACPVHARRRPGEAWEVHQRRRLADPLRARRRALGWSQATLGAHVGISCDSIQRWEHARVPPRPIAHVVWAQKLGLRLAIVPNS